jgi:hypothetical protein
VFDGFRRRRKVQQGEGRLQVQTEKNTSAYSSDFVPQHTLLQQKDSKVGGAGAVSPMQLRRICEQALQIMATNLNIDEVCAGRVSVFLFPFFQF